ncbi:hypothetical protein SHKM778_56360 [Streptomyces sp. KM77-8]|uniref:Periplasmic binding protein domain-containing protein n=1 Tax=Streptomyces haneummycinicus TaxID=3074435 RepID=A0AAT9HP68_9ACTN
MFLKAPDHPEITAAVGRLAAAGIPVVTLVTDLPASARIGHVGSDNRAAGATAAYLMGQWLGDRPGHVLTSLSSGAFRNEEEREMGFRATMRARQPGRALVEIAEGHGLDAATQYDLVRAALERDPGIRAVYSIGGGNIATLRAFSDAGRSAWCSWRTTSTTTTRGCCGSTGCRRCFTMICGTICGRPAS